MVNSTRATDANINALINVHLAEFYDRLVAAGPPDYFATSTTVTTISGTTAYALPTDFRSLVNVYSNVTSTRKREIPPLQEGYRGAFDAPQGVYDVTLKYVASPPVLTSDSTVGTGLLDGISGWDELVVQLCARALRRREGRDVSSFDAAVNEARARVMANAPKRSQAGPRYVHDTEEADYWSIYSLSPSVDAWELSAGYLNLYQLSPGYP